MKVRPSALFPLFRSDTQGAIVAELFGSQQREITVADLELSTGASAPTLSRELRRLTTAGVIDAKKYGSRLRTYHPNTSHPLYHAISEIVAYTYGPVPMLEQALSTVEGIKAAFIYGSWAARREGEDGPPPNDIDVLVIGVPNEDSLNVALRDAESWLRREINVTRMTADRWATSDDPFTLNVKARPLRALRLSSLRG